MKDSLLITIFKSLQKNEFKELDRYIHSVFFLKRKDTAVLFDAMKIFYPEFGSDKLVKKELYKKVFPGKSYNDVLMRKLVSDLLRMTKGYLAYNNFSCAEFNILRFLANELNFRGINRNFIFDKTINSAISILEKGSRRDHLYYNYKYTLEEERIYSNSDLTQTLYKRNWQPVLENLVSYNLLSLMDYYVFLSFVMKNTASYYKLDLMNEIISFLEKSSYKNKPVFSFYYNMLKLTLNENDTSYYFLAEKLLHRHKAMISRAKVSGAYVQLADYCTERIERGYNEFVKIRFGLHKRIFKGKFCYESGFVIPRQFGNMVISALEGGELKYAEKFIDLNKDKLFPALKKNTLCLCNSLVNFYKKNYDESRNFLAEFRVVEYFDKMKIKSLEIMIDYEMDLTEPVISLVDSAKHFLSTYREVSLHYREKHFNFLKAVTKLIKARTGNEKAIRELKKLKTGNEIITNRTWLNMKIDELSV